MKTISIHFESYPTSTGKLQQPTFLSQPEDLTTYAFDIWAVYTSNEVCYASKDDERQKNSRSDDSMLLSESTVNLTDKRWCCRDRRRLKWLITWENFIQGWYSISRTGWKKSRLHEIFQPGLKLKSEVNPGRNLSVACVVLAICIFSRQSIVFSARAEKMITWDFSVRVAQTGLKLSSCNRELCFSSILSEGQAGISARAENFHVVSLLEWGNTVNDVCVKWKRRFTCSMTPLEFGIIHFLCFLSQILWKEKPFVNQERLLLKLSTILFRQCQIILLWRTP